MLDLVLVHTQLIQKYIKDFSMMNTLTIVTYIVVILFLLLFFIKSILFKHSILFYYVINNNSVEIFSFGSYPVKSIGIEEIKDLIIIKWYDITTVFSARWFINNLFTQKRLLIIYNDGSVIRRIIITPDNMSEFIRYIHEVNPRLKMSDS